MSYYSRLVSWRFSLTSAGDLILHGKLEEEGREGKLHCCHLVAPHSSSKRLQSVPQPPGQKRPDPGKPSRSCDTRTRLMLLLLLFFRDLQATKYINNWKEHKINHLREAPAGDSSATPHNNLFPSCLAAPPAEWGRWKVHKVKTIIAFTGLCLRNVLDSGVEFRRLLFLVADALARISSFTASFWV